MRLRGYMLELQKCRSVNSRSSVQQKLIFVLGWGDRACMVTGATNLAPNGAANASPPEL